MGWSGDNWELRLGDSLDLMGALEPGSVDAIVTSPPYPDQRTYASGEPAPENGRRRPTNESRRARRDAVGEWLEWFPPYLGAMERVLAPRGSLMLNLGAVVRDGEESHYADETLRRARASGWRLLHRIVWHKPNAAPMSHPAFMSPTAEYVFWLARTTDAFRGYVDAEEGYDPECREPYAPISAERHRYGFTVRKGDERYVKRGMTNPQHPDGRRPGTVMTHAVGGIRGSKHPALMALGLADRLVRCASPIGGVVLDPFAGWATTGVAALRAGRRFVGFELRPKYAEDAADRLRDWHVDARWSPPPLTPEGDEHPSLFAPIDGGGVRPMRGE